MDQSDFVPWKIMWSRQDYLNSKCTFDQYYGQFVTSRVRELILQNWTVQQLTEAYAQDEHFNTLPLHRWDNIAPWFLCASEMKLRGDTPSLAGRVCILKAAAKQLVLEHLHPDTAGGTDADLNSCP